VEIEHPIKTLGQHNATVKIATGLTARIIIVVERGA
jgi:ribosomal protein L9